MEVIVTRCAGLDVHKDTVMACVRVPGAGRPAAQDGARVPDVHGVDLRGAAGLAGRRRRVTQVAMEATGVYWKPVWHVLEELAGLELLLANAQHVKNVPGRKTDVADAAWLAQLCECGLLRGSASCRPGRSPSCGT